MINLTDREIIGIIISLREIQSMPFQEHRVFKTDGDLEVREIDSLCKRLRCELDSNQQMREMNKRVMHLIS